MTNDPGSKEGRTVGGTCGSQCSPSVLKPVAASLVVKKPVLKNLIRAHIRLNFTRVFKFVLLWKSALHNVTQRSPTNSAIRHLFTDF